MTSAPTVSDSIAQQVRAHRKRRGLTLAQLATECERLGALQLSMSALANIERGQTGESKRRRRDVSTDELVVLAKALQIPPLLLLFPVGTVDEVELLPGQRMNTWAAAMWFTGEAYPAEDVATHWAVPLYLFRQHMSLLSEYTEALTDRLFAPDPTDPDRVKQRAHAEARLRRLRDIRAEMRRHGLTPPALDDNLRHIDERRHAYLTPEQADAYAEHPGDLKFVDYAALRQPTEYKPGDADKIRAAHEFARNFEAEGEPGDEDES